MAEPCNKQNISFIGYTINKSIYTSNKSKDIFQCHVNEKKKNTFSQNGAKRNVAIRQIRFNIHFIHETKTEARKHRRIRETEMLMEKKE